jgi:hypothetical protein
MIITQLVLKQYESALLSDIKIQYVNLLLVLINVVVLSSRVDLIRFIIVCIVFLDFIFVCNINLMCESLYLMIITQFVLKQYELLIIYTTQMTSFISLYV